MKAKYIIVDTNPENEYIQGFCTLEEAEKGLKARASFLLGIGFNIEVLHPLVLYKAVRVAEFVDTYDANNMHITGVKNVEID